jgi:hypothetical protein
MICVKKMIMTCIISKRLSRYLVLTLIVTKCLFLFLDLYFKLYKKNKEEKMIIIYHLDEKNSIPFGQLMFERGFNNVFLLTGGKI